jgi:hypothetical protein
VTKLVLEFIGRHQRISLYCTIVASPCTQTHIIMTLIMPPTCTLACPLDQHVYDWRDNLYITCLQARVSNRRPITKNMRIFKVRNLFSFETDCTLVFSRSRIRKHVLKEHILNRLSSGQSSWLQIRRSGFDSRRYQIFWEVVGLEQGPLSLVSTTEELLGRNNRGSGLESRDYGRRKSADYATFL